MFVLCIPGFLSGFKNGEKTLNSSSDQSFGPRSVGTRDSFCSPCGPSMTAAKRMEDICLGEFNMSVPCLPAVSLKYANLGPSDWNDFSHLWFYRFRLAAFGRSSSSDRRDLLHTTVLPPTET